MQVITDEYMRQALQTAKSYCIVLLKAGPRRNEPGVEKIIWEHGRRNFALREEGVLSIVCPVSDGSNFKGVYIFNVSADEVKKVMDDDPGVKSEVFVYELHECRGFPGSCL